MPKFNDLDLEQWRELDINTNSLWLIGERAKTGKHRHRRALAALPLYLRKSSTFPHAA